MKIALIVVACSQKQNECWWPSYQKANTNIDHDLIVIHRDMNYLPRDVQEYKNVILENERHASYGSQGKILKAFGSYREYWNKYKDQYDMFGFISDDVIVKADNWLQRSAELLFKFDKLGFVGTQIFNGGDGQYPHPSHCRAPCWFAKSSALKEIKWEFSNDHEGEMRIADQFVEAGYFGAQVGNKINIAYDALENGGKYPGDHISAIMEKEFFHHDIKQKFDDYQSNRVDEIPFTSLEFPTDYYLVKSPFEHIGVRRVISQIQPFHGLIYDRSLELARPYMDTYEFNINILKGC